MVENKPHHVHSIHEMKGKGNNLCPPMKSIYWVNFSGHVSTHTPFARIRSHRQSSQNAELGILLHTEKDRIGTEIETSVYDKLVMNVSWNIVKRRQYVIFIYA